jgi:hypothetical protein
MTRVVGSSLEVVRSEGGVGRGWADGIGPFLRLLFGYLKTEYTPKINSVKNDLYIGLLLRGPHCLFRAEVGSSRGIIHSYLHDSPRLLGIHYPYVHQAGILAGPVQHPTLRWRGWLNLGTGTRPRLLFRRPLRVPEAALARVRELRNWNSEGRLVVILTDNQTVFEHNGSGARIPAAALPAAQADSCQRSHSEP